MFPTAIPVQSRNLTEAITFFYRLISVPVFDKSDITCEILAIKHYITTYRGGLIIAGYPSEVVNIENRVNVTRVGSPESWNVKLVVLGGEPVSESLRLKLTKLYNTNYIIDLYGAVEGGVLGIYAIPHKAYVSFGDRIYFSKINGKITYSILIEDFEKPAFVLLNYYIGDSLHNLSEKEGYFIYKQITRVDDTLIISGATFKPHIEMPLILSRMRDKGIQVDTTLWKIIVAYDKKYGNVKSIHFYLASLNDKEKELSCEELCSIMHSIAMDPAVPLVLCRGLIECKATLLSLKEFERRFPEVIYPEINPNKKAKYVDKIYL